MDPNTSQLLELHVRLDPALAGRLRRFASVSERTLGGSIRLLVKDGLDRLEATEHNEPSDRQEDNRAER
jgi:hypothetical protein